MLQSRTSVASYDPPYIVLYLSPARLDIMAPTSDTVIGKVLNISLYDIDTISRRRQMINNIPSNIIH